MTGLVRRGRRKRRRRILPNRLRPTVFRTWIFFLLTVVAATTTTGLLLLGKSSMSTTLVFAFNSAQPVVIPGSGHSTTTSTFDSSSRRCGHSRIRLARSMAMENNNNQYPPHLNRNDHYNNDHRSSSFSPQSQYPPRRRNINNNNDKDIGNIFEQNRIWVDHVQSQDPAFFHRLGSGHNPKYLWIGCADARVPANEIMGEEPGSVFVIRNIANMVVNTDFNLMSALQYAVSVLKVEHILLCGHYECGGIRASMEAKDHVPPLENWLRNIRDVYRLHRDELDAIADPEQRHRRLVEVNVLEQCLNLYKTGVIQKRRIETHHERQLPYATPRIHACVFDPKTGDLKRLDMRQMKTYLQELHEIYDLYSVEDEEQEDALAANMNWNRPITSTVFHEDNRVSESPPDRFYGKGISASSSPLPPSASSSTSTVTSPGSYYPPFSNNENPYQNGNMHARRPNPNGAWDADSSQNHPPMLNRQGTWQYHDLSTGPPPWNPSIDAEFDHYPVEAQFPQSSAPPPYGSPWNNDPDLRPINNDGDMPIDTESRGFD